MTKNEMRGKAWFENTICNNCRYCERCDMTNEDIALCIEAEKLKKMMNGIVTFTTR